jgi:ParB family chromosome partitioning protein
MASKKSALGRGLSALLPSQDAPAPDDEAASGSDDIARSSQLYRFDDRSRLAGRVTDVEIAKVRPNPYQPRQSFNDAALDELAASIKQLGIIQPITVRAMGGGHFEVISGERRLRASRRAGLERIPAFVREANTEQMLEMALVENVQREELNPIEVALGYQRLVEECGLTQEEVAQKVSKSRASVANFLRLLRLPPRIQAALRDGEVAMGHARALVTIDDEAVQNRLLQQAIDEDLSVRAVEQLARTWHQAQEAAEDEAPAEPEPVVSPAPSRDDLQLDDFRSRLRSHFSTHVRIRHKKGGEGHIEIAYYSAEDLERIMELLN